ncbi:MAG: lmo0937 family membrane protein [Spirochaetes bacterium]|nr:lmo0937 family membrane protein [Spirochaetota bacterium]
MLLIIGVILVVLWLFGLITSYTLGGGIHVLLVIAVIVIIIWFITRNR